jgi:hypothetical protein
VTASETTHVVSKVVTATPSSMTSDVTAQAVVDLTASFNKQMEKMAEENRILHQKLPTIESAVQPTSSATNSSSATTGDDES